VFPSFIAAIFIDDVLRSLHHPYVLQSLWDDGVMSLFIPRVRWIHVMWSLHEHYAFRCLVVYVYASALFTYVCATCVLSRICGNRGD
jgi:hypothetical protein